MIGKRIHEIRLEKHMSMSALAKRAAVAKSYLSAIERDIQVNPSIQIIERISAVLEVPIQTLLEKDITDADKPSNRPPQQP